MEISCKGSNSSSNSEWYSISWLRPCHSEWPGDFHGIAELSASSGSQVWWQGRRVEGRATAGPDFPLPQISLQWRLQLETELDTSSTLRTDLSSDSSHRISHLTEKGGGSILTTQLSSFNYCQLGSHIIWSDRDLTTTDCYEDKSYSWEILISRNARSDSGLGKGVRAEFAPLWGFTSCLYWSSSSPVSSSGQWCIYCSMRARR